MKHKPSPAAILLVPLVVAVVLALFAWPSANLEPRDLPIGVAGAPAAAAAIEQRLAQRDGAFDVHRLADEAAARAAIEDREVYGAFVAAPQSAKVLTASAASPAVAQLIGNAAAEGPEGPLPVEDVVSAGPRGAALPSSVLPLLIAGIVTGVAGLAARDRRRRAGGAARGRLGARRARRDADRAGLARRRRGRLVGERGRAEPHRRRDRRGGRPASTRCSGTRASRSPR